MFEAYGLRDILVFLKNLSIQLSRKCPLTNYQFFMMSFSYDTFFRYLSANYTNFGCPVAKFAFQLTPLPSTRTLPKLLNDSFSLKKVYRKVVLKIILIYFSYLF